MNITQIGDVRGYLGPASIMAFFKAFLPLIFLGGYGFLSLYTGQDGLLYMLVTILVVLIITLFVYKHVKKHLLLSERQKQIFEFARSNNLSTFHEASNVDGIKTTETSLFSLQEKEDATPAIRNRIWDEDNWVFYDFEYGIYKDAKFPIKRILYSVICYQLPRSLPHIFFDSKNSRKEQFKNLFDQRQKHTLEGGFDNYFDTYFPPTYTIDSMSFISPEVIEALIEARDYDIEILDDKLYLYGPISTDSVRQIQQMKQLAENIIQKLSPNIQNYRDVRVQYSQGREFVAPLGKRLQKQVLPPWFFGLAVVIFFGMIILSVIFRFY